MLQEIDNVDPMLEQILRSVSNLADMIPKLKKLGTSLALKHLAPTFVNLDRIIFNCFSNNCVPGSH